MAENRSFLARLVGISATPDPEIEIAYPIGMVEAAREAKKRLKKRGTLQDEIDAQKEINGRVSQFGKAA